MMYLLDLKVYPILQNQFNQIIFYKVGLSIDGGGIRGIIPAQIITYICKNLKREVHEIFDVVGGTSIGGILALGVTGTLDGKNPVSRGVDLVQFFEDHGNQIFNKSKIVAIWNNLRDKSKYDPVGIESILKKNFQNCKLSDIVKGTNVICTAVKRENIQGKNMAKIFRSKEAVFNPNKNFFMKDVARATSAAPTYFPSAEIKNINGTKKYSLIDGALGQNNPSKLVLDDIKTEAMNSGDEKKFFLLSLGTGQPIAGSQISQNAGLFNLVPIMQSLGNGALAYLDKDVEKSAEGQYLRIDPEIPLKQSEADLDNNDTRIIEIYKQYSLNEAVLKLSHQHIYGPFYDQNLIEWLAENTARKKILMFDFLNYLF
ncbi:patatin-like phospholipase family protein, putative [Ichthyophthirius multifiliis]|uniref:Patatin-like phospholipase family protein, putative n=1 Tax=Ichthyophthirius multifiliis TaxID=5932 RepID=G0QZM8_ICHMU|nr:patatin-like phospholipase family protein, putative [Ichthyophthirius multifiliis]EGR29322.1 patatin-like phospholipase family protein, putative [Ichthyophthirius multifiliis]|eukprot:XP_004030558.1 patatin-like phospholipase family protein, putative [Ichthyophthirius multifiliis]